MFRLGGLFLISLYTLTLSILGLISKHVYRLKTSLAEEKGSSFSENLSRLDDSERNDSSAETECSVLLQGGLVCNSSKYEVMCGKDLSGFLEEPKMVEFVVQELFVASDNIVVSSDQVLDSESTDEKGLFEQNLKQNKEEFEQDLKENDEEFDQEPETVPFYFKLLNTSYSTIGENQEKISKMEDLDEERKDGDDSLKCFNGEEEVDGKEEKLDFRVEEINHMEDECFSYEVELIPSSVVPDQEYDANEDDGMSITPREIEKNDSHDWMSTFLDQTKSNEKVEDPDDEYIELEPQEIAPTSSSCVYANKSEESSGRRDSDCDGDIDGDEDEDELDVLSEHQNLVQQMKMELKNCRIRGLPTISEESETPKMIEDLKPLEIDPKIGYKDVVQGIHKFYKSYSEKMKKLDILCYQTTHAISFLQLKESPAYPPCKKRADSSTLFFWPTKVRKIYADPTTKPINEMRKDLELVYVGQMCVSWEILSWLNVKAQELLEYESHGTHSYNQAADEFQQFQVLVQRFVEDEQFGGRRDDSYVKSRCMIRSLMQVPTIKDDCVKMKERSEERDVITLEMLVEIIRESMVVFHEFVLADKKATNGGLNKIDFQEFGSSELILEVVSSLHKKERRMREKIRSQNCIVKKLKKHQERRRSESETLAAQVELRLVWRVLSMSRLSEERLVWCKKKLNNISFVGRNVRREASFLLFPC